jgi:hypothetical protein
MFHGVSIWDNNGTMEQVWNTPYIVSRNTTLTVRVQSSQSSLSLDLNPTFELNRLPVLITHRYPCYRD